MPLVVSRDIVAEALAPPEWPSAMYLSGIVRSHVSACMCTMRDAKLPESPTPAHQEVGGAAVALSEALPNLARTK